MGKAQKAEAAKRAAAEEARLKAQNKPWYQSMWMPLGVIAAFGASAFGYAWKKGEENKYGNLLPYKDQLPERMVIKNVKGDAYVYEDLLPYLKKGDNGKLTVNYYIENSHLNIGRLRLEPVSDSARKAIQSSIEIWKEFFNFVEVHSPFAADMKFYGEREVMQRGGLVGRAVTKNNASGAFAFYENELSHLGPSVLLNPVETAKITNDFYVQNTVTHEIGHLFGLSHPEITLAFDILKTQGYSNGDLAPDELSIFIARNAEKIYPQFPKLTIMLSDPGDDSQPFIPAEFDRKAINIILQRVKENYPNGAQRVNNQPSSMITEPDAELFQRLQIQR